MSPYDLAYEYALHTNECIFLTGKAGTGKTTFLRRLQRECPKQMVVCAPTGVAAINAEGMTIHSLLQLPPQIFRPEQSQYKLLWSEMRLTERKLRLIRNIELLVIDEVSMVRADLLDMIDATLRHFRRRYTEPFGGVQVLFIGDLYQLSPVAREDDWMTLRQYYTGPYFFQALVFQQLRPVYIELDKVYRQSNQDFIQILNQVRTNTLTREGLDALNARYNPDYRDKEAILLSTHNRKVDAINAHELEALRGKEYSFEAIIKKDYPESMYPMDATLVLKKGARVMFIKNDSSTDKAYYNGKLGTVVALENDRIVVQCEGDTAPITVHQETWEHLRYVPDPEHNDAVRTEVAGTFTHFPLRLAWAVTIHKAQGLTFDRVMIDAEDAFASGQVYVALSRCRSLEGITLCSRIPQSALTNARDVAQFTASQPTMEDMEQRLTPAEQTYFLKLLCGVYDFRALFHQAERLRKMVTDLDCFNQPVTDEFLKNMTDTVADWQRVGETFQRQLQQIMLASEPDEQFLLQRLRDAYGYFAPRMETAIDTLQHSPAFTDNRDAAKEYQTRIEEITIDLMRQLHLLSGLREKPSIHRYFALRQSFLQPTLQISAKGEEKKLTKEDCEHPELYEQLRRLRNRLARESGKLPYAYASTATLIAIVNRLPMNRSQLMKVKGFGPKTMGLWGDEIIEEVRKYLLKHST